MEKKIYCLGHRKGFQHLHFDFEGLEKIFDIGFKFEERESDNYAIDQMTGIKAWAEPYLALYISVVQKGSERIPRILHYGLTRSKFGDALQPNDDDRKKLLDLALPHIVSDIKLLLQGKTPITLQKPRML